MVFSKMKKIFHLVMNLLRAGMLLFIQQIFIEGHFIPDPFRCWEWNNLIPEQSSHLNFYLVKWLTKKFFIFGLTALLTMTVHMEVQKYSRHKSCSIWTGRGGPQTTRGLYPRPSPTPPTLQFLEVPTVTPRLHRGQFGNHLSTQPLNFQRRNWETEIQTSVQGHIAGAWWTHLEQSVHDQGEWDPRFSRSQVSRDSDFKPSQKELRLYKGKNFSKLKI